MIIIDNEFKNLIPTLSKEEFEQLEKNCITEGIRDPIVIWGNIIIDGHNRYEIATKHNLNYVTISKVFDTKDEVIDWMINNQLGRRNLSRETQSYLRGLQYEREKKKEVFKGNQYTKSGEGQNVPQQNTAEKLAEQHGVNEKTIKRDAEYSKAVDTIVSNTAPEIKQAILNREIEMTKKETEQLSKLEPEKQKAIIEKAIEKSIPIREVDINKPHVSHNSGENEWYTPIEYINKAKEVMGSIDLDPASSIIANKTVNADKIYTIDDNGLEQKWNGNVWLNPPYSSDLIGKFANKLVDSFKNNDIEQAIVMVNNATETQWFTTMIDKASAIVFPKGRIKFVDMNGNVGNAPLQGQAFIYFGSNANKFLDTFMGYGWGAYL